MTNVLVLHRVNDYDAWRAVFDEHKTVRDSHGQTGETVLRAAGDENNVLVITEWPSIAEATAFTEDPSLPEAMARAGVVGEPRIEFFDAS